MEAQGYERSSGNVKRDDANRETGQSIDKSIVTICIQLRLDTSWPQA